MTSAITPEAFITQLKSSDRLKIVSIALSHLTKLQSSNSPSLDSHISALLKWASSTNRRLLFHQVTFFKAEHTISHFYTTPKSQIDPSTLPQLTSISSSISPLIIYFKKKENKKGLIKSYILLSQISLLQEDLNSAKSYLTAARATASVGFVPKDLQHSLDFNSGIVYLISDEPSLASNYFFDCLENFPNFSNLKFFIISCIVSQNFTEAKKFMKKFNKLIENNKTIFHKYAKLSNSIINNNLRKFSDCLYEDFIKSNLDNFESNLEIKIIKKLFDVVLDKNILKELELYGKVKLEKLEREIGVKEEVIKERIIWFVENNKVKGKLGKDEENKFYYEMGKGGKDGEMVEEFVRESAFLLKYLGKVMKKNQESFDMDSVSNYISE